MIDEYNKTQNEPETQQQFRRQTLETLENLRTLYDEPASTQTGQSGTARRMGQAPGGEPHIYEIDPDDTGEPYQEMREPMSEQSSGSVSSAATPRGSMSQDTWYQRAVEDHERMEVFRRREQKRNLAQGSRPGQTSRPDAATRRRMPLAQNPYASADYVKASHASSASAPTGDIREMETSFAPQRETMDTPKPNDIDAELPFADAPLQQPEPVTGTATAALEPTPQRERKARRGFRRRAQTPQERETARQKRAQRNRARTAAARASVERTKERLRMPEQEEEKPISPHMRKLLVVRRQRFLQLFVTLFVALIVLFSAAASWHVATHPGDRGAAREQYPAVDDTSETKKRIPAPNITDQAGNTESDNTQTDNTQSDDTQTDNT